MLKEFIMLHEHVLKENVEKIVSSYNDGVDDDYIYVDEINLSRKLVDIIYGYERGKYCGYARRHAFKLLLGLWNIEAIQDDLIYLAVKMKYDHVQVDVIKAISDKKIAQNIAFHLMFYRPESFVAVKLCEALFGGHDFQDNSRCKRCGMKEPGCHKWKYSHSYMYHGDYGEGGDFEVYRCNHCNETMEVCIGDI